MKQHAARFEKKYGKDAKLTPAFALAQNATTHTTMTSANDSLPCLTTRGTTRMFHPQRLRWLTGREKAAASGLPVSEAQAKAAGLERCINWREDFAWHVRVGNGQVLPNVGLVILSALANLKVRQEIPPSIFDIPSPSFPEGLTPLPSGEFLLNVAGTEFKITEKQMAVEAHQALHVLWQPSPELLLVPSCSPLWF